MSAAKKPRLSGVIQDGRYRGSPREASYAPQRISGQEYRSFLPTGVGSFNHGAIIRIPVGNDAIKLGLLTHFKVGVRFQQRKRNSTEDWEWLPENQTPENKIICVENFGTALFSNVRTFAGPHELKYDQLLPRAQYLKENLQNALINPQLVQATKLQANEDYHYSPLLNSMWRLDKESVVEHVKRENAMKAVLSSTGNVTGDNFTALAKAFESGPSLNKQIEFTKTVFNHKGRILYPRPSRFPCAMVHPSVQKEIVFPNTGEPLIIQVELERDQSRLWNYVDPNDAMEYNLVILGIEFCVEDPRYTNQGFDAAKSTVGDLGFETVTWVQYMKYIKEDDFDCHFTLHHLELPHFLLFQLFDKRVFLAQNEPKTNEFYHRAKSLDSVAKAQIEYGNSPLSLNNANFDDLRSSQSTFMRQRILKENQPLGFPVRSDYFEGLEDFAQPFLLLSFCSNPVTKERLIPVNQKNRERNQKQNLNVRLKSNDARGLGHDTNGVLVISCLYHDYANYKRNIGRFEDKGLEASLITS